MPAMHPTLPEPQPHKPTPTPHHRVKRPRSASRNDVEIMDRRSRRRLSTSSVVPPDFLASRSAAAHPGSNPITTQLPYCPPPAPLDHPVLANLPITSDRALALRCTAIILGDHMTPGLWSPDNLKQNHAVVRSVFDAFAYTVSHRVLPDRTEFLSQFYSIFHFPTPGVLHDFLTEWDHRPEEFGTLEAYPVPPAPAPAPVSTLAVALSNLATNSVTSSSNAQNYGESGTWRGRGRGGPFRGRGMGRGR